MPRTAFEAGPFTLEDIKFSIDTVVASVLAMIQPQAEHKGLRLEVEIGPMSP